MIDFTGLHVLVVGDVMLDRYLYGAVERVSPEAPVPVVEGTLVEGELVGTGDALAQQPVHRAP